MGLFDLFRRPPDQPPEHIAELYRRVGKLDAGVSALELQWQSYRDELRRLVQRLEKREQRAAAREDAPQAPNGHGEVSQLPPLDPISLAVHQRRQRRR